MKKSIFGCSGRHRHHLGHRSIPAVPTTRSADGARFVGAAARRPLGKFGLEPVGPRP